MKPVLKVRPMPAPSTAPGPVAGPSVDTTPHRSGAKPPRGGDGPSPRLPHEHDESPDSQQGTDPDGLMQQAHRDVRRGLVDTDRGPVMDRVYEDEVRPQDGATKHRAAPSADGTGTPAPDESADPPV